MCISSRDPTVQRAHPPQLPSLASSRLFVLALDIFPNGVRPLTKIIFVSLDDDLELADCFPLPHDQLILLALWGIG